MASARASLVRVVTDFYARVLAAPDLAPYFDGVAMETLIKHQTAFINAIGGSGSTHTDEQIARVHAPLGVSRAAFDLLIQLLDETLVFHSLPRSEAEMIIDQFERRRDLVVASG
jgi:hemoglobin